MTNFDNLSRKVETLHQQFYLLADRVAGIEKYLESLNERVKDSSFIVTGSLQTEQITPLNISESELVQVYNDVPKVLLKNSIIAELTTESYRESIQNEPVFLEEDKNGKYWIIVCNQDHIWLVPDIDIKLKIYKLKTVVKLFDFHGDTPLVNTHFILIKPAKMSSLPNGKEWKLEEKGILEFSDPFSQIKFELPDFPELKEDPSLEIQRINQTLNDLKLQFEQSQQERINLESQIINISEIRDTQVDTNLETLKINKQINGLKLQLEEIQQEKINLELQIRNILNIRDTQVDTNLEIEEIHQQLDDLKLELNRSHELRKSSESYIVEMSKELDDLKLQLSYSEEKRKELESRLDKIPVLRDYVYRQNLQIDLLKARVESIENHYGNKFNNS